MKNLRNPILATAFCLCSILYAGSGQAQAGSASGSAPDLMGEIDIEETTDYKETYSNVQDRVIQYFRSLEQGIPSLVELGTMHLPEIDEAMLQYLTAAYLYCSVNQGTCPFVLDTLLEIDVINARLRSSSDCPVLTRFWKLWLKNDMEKRHEYLVRTGYLNITNQFKQSTRPRYIRCADTVKKAVDSDLGNIPYFKERYKEPSSIRNSMAQMTTYLDIVKQKVPSLNGALGIRVEGRPQGTGEKERAKPKKGASKKTR